MWNVELKNHVLVDVGVILICFEMIFYNSLALYITLTVSRQM